MATTTKQVKDTFYQNAAKLSRERLLNQVKFFRDENFAEAVANKPTERLIDILWDNYILNLS